MYISTHYTLQCIDNYPSFGSKFSQLVDNQDVQLRISVEQYLLEHRQYFRSDLWQCLCTFLKGVNNMYFDIRTYVANKLLIIQLHTDIALCIIYVP